MRKIKWVNRCLFWAQTESGSRWRLWKVLWMAKTCSTGQRGLKIWLKQGLEKCRRNAEAKGLAMCLNENVLSFIVHLTHRRSLVKVWAWSSILDQKTDLCYPLFCVTTACVKSIHTLCKRIENTDTVKFSKQDNTCCANQNWRAVCWTRIHAPFI